MTFAQELATAREYGISPLVLLEQILPVARGARRVSKLTSDEFLCSPLTDHKTRRSIRRYVERYDLDLMILPGMYAPGVFGPELYFFHRKDADSVHEAGEKIRRLCKDMTRQYELVEMDGDLLGYCKCCISAHMSDKRQHVFQDAVRVQRQLVNGNYVVDFGSLLKVRKDVLPAFFTSGFNPCKPDCSYAAETGNRVLSSMVDEEQDACYRVFLNNTVLASSNMMNMASRSPFEAKKLYRRFRENELVIQEKPVVLV